MTRLAPHGEFLCPRPGFFSFRLAVAVGNVHSMISANGMSGEELCVKLHLVQKICRQFEQPTLRINKDI